jgi:AhpD family alkylhydroperoxidase
MTTTATQRLDIASEARDSYRAMLALDRTIGESGLDARLLNMVLYRASQINGCGYCQDMHARDARKAGERQQRLDVLAGWREATFFSEREQAALALTEAVTLIADGLPDDVYDEAARVFEPAELSALIFAIAAINAWNRIAISASMHPEETDE